MELLSVIVLLNASMSSLAIIIRPTPAGTCADDVARGGKIRLVISEPSCYCQKRACRLSALNRGPGRSNTRMPAVLPTVVCILIHVGEFRVFDFYASHVFVDVVAPHDDIF